MLEVVFGAGIRLVLAAEDDAVVGGLLGGLTCICAIELSIDGIESGFRDTLPELVRAGATLEDLAPRNQINMNAVFLQCTHEVPSDGRHDEEGAEDVGSGSDVRTRSPLPLTQHPWALDHSTYCPVVASQTQRSGEDIVRYAPNVRLHA